MKVWYRLRFSQCKEATVIACCVLGAITGSTTLSSAASFLGGEEYDISTFCSNSAPRRTIVYIDDEIIEDQKTDWANRLDQKLRSNLLPNERVAVVQLSSALGSVKEIWSACWPDYSAPEKEAMAKDRFIFSKPPLKMLESQQAVFRQGFGAALTKIYAASHRPKREIVAGADTQKSIVAAIMSDESRFAATKENLRVIFYSDMWEQSKYADLRSTQDIEKLGTETAAKLKFNTDGSSIYVFGVIDKPDQAHSAIENAKTFWTSFFKQANGYVRGFGSELSIPGLPPVSSQSYELEVKVQGTSRFAKLRLFADMNGQLQDSYIFFTPEANAAVEGLFQCNNLDHCNLDARTLTGTVTLSPYEELKMNGLRKKLTGSLGFPNDVTAGERRDKASFEVEATVQAP